MKIHMYTTSIFFVLSLFFFGCETKFQCTPEYGCCLPLDDLCNFDVGYPKEGDCIVYSQGRWRNKRCTSTSGTVDMIAVNDVREYEMNINDGMLDIVLECPKGYHAISGSYRTFGMDCSHGCPPLVPATFEELCETVPCPPPIFECFLPDCKYFQPIVYSGIAREEGYVLSLSSPTVDYKGKIRVYIHAVCASDLSTHLQYNWY